MSRVDYTQEQLKKLKLVEVDGVYVNIDKVTNHKKVDKIVPGSSFGLNVTPNAKVKNAVKSGVNGVKFDSNLEKTMYNLLKGAGVDFDFQVKYVLQERFSYNNEAVRAISLTVDFLLGSKNMIIDTKGLQTQQGAIRWKMLKKWLIENWRTFDPYRVLPTIELPSNKKECELLLNRILYEP